MPGTENKATAHTPRFAAAIHVRLTVFKKSRTVRLSLERKEVKLNKNAASEFQLLDSWVYLSSHLRFQYFVEQF